MEFKSYVFVDEGLFVGKMDEAELMKTFITEPKYKSQKKFCEPLSLKSYHNFVGASNSHKAVAISPDDRRGSGSRTPNPCNIPQSSGLTCGPWFTTPLSGRSSTSI